MENIINFPPLSEEVVIKAALDRLAKEKEDFESFKGTQTFYKLLGIYKPGKDEEVDPSVISNSNLGSNGAFFADGVAEDVYNTLCKFVEEVPYFAAVILKSKGSFTGCLAYAIHDFISDDSEKKGRVQYAAKSDFYVFSKAVEFYFEGSSIKFNMEIVKPDGFVDIPITAKDINEQTDYKAACEDAQAEKLAEEKRKAEEKKKSEERAKKKAEREAKKKAAEERKKQAEEFKKSQQSLFDGSEDTAPTAENKPATPVPKPVVIKAKKPKEEPKKDESLQLSLF